MRCATSALSKQANNDATRMQEEERCRRIGKGRFKDRKDGVPSEEEKKSV